MRLLGKISIILWLNTPWFAYGETSSQKGMHLIVLVPPFLLAVVLILGLIIVIRMEKSRMERIIKESYEADCKRCKRGKRIRADFPYCEDCLGWALRKTKMLVVEAEQRIKLAQEIGLSEQVQGTRRWFYENLPSPIKAILGRAILFNLKRCFPQAKPFYPAGYDRYLLDVEDIELNIPSEGLKILKKIIS